MSQPDKQQILRQIAAIAAMERGKLSAYTFEDRPGAAGPYHRLQRWENGKNQSRHARMALKFFSGGGSGCHAGFLGIRGVDG